MPENVLFLITFDGYTDFVSWIFYFFFKDLKNEFMLWLMYAYQLINEPRLKTAFHYSLKGRAYNNNYVI